MIRALDGFIGNLHSFLGRPHKPEPGSLASEELKDAHWGEVARDAQLRAVLSFEFALRSLESLPSLCDPATDRAICACLTARALIEACATAAWASDPSEDLPGRCGRYFALRYASLVEQRSFARVTGHLADAELRLDEAVNQARRLGVRERFEANNPLKRIGLGPHVPNATPLCKDELGMEFQYRLFSAVAHGQPWAIQYLAYRIGVKVDQDMQLIERATHPWLSCYICLSAINAIKIPARNLWSWFGWDREGLDLSIGAAIEHIVMRSHQNLR